MNHELAKAGLDRRGLLRSGSAATLAGLAGISPMRAIAASVAPKSSLIPQDRISKFGFGVIDSEAVLADKDGSVFGFGSNGIVYRVDPSGAVEHYATLPEGSVPAGFVKDRSGNFIYCCLGKSALMRLDSERKVTLFADHAGAVPLASPNFASYDCEGNLYCSLTSVKYDFAHIQDMLASTEPTGALVRFRPDGRGELIASEIFSANGTAISPQEDAIYVLESRLNRCLRIAIRKNGSTGKPEVFSHGFPSVPDGMAFDADSRLYVTCVAKRQKNQEALADLNLKATNQLIRIDTNGEWELLVDDKEGKNFTYPTNCAFGGEDMKQLYVANVRGSHVTRIDLGVRGHPLYHQR